MEEVLKLCISLDTSAKHTFNRMAKVCPNPELAATFSQMSLEEADHVTWWATLLDQWNAGLIPRLADKNEMLLKLKEISRELSAVIPEDLTPLTSDSMLEIALRMEFFMLDPLFSELLELLDPGTATSHEDEYAHHVIGLISAIGTHYSRREMAPILAQILSESFRDRRRLAILAVRDALTGLYNRRGFFDYLAQWAAWAERYQRPLAVLLADVDRFKAVNDTFGHLTGDEALKSIADALSLAVRKADVVGRYGGDEFAILVPETSIEDLATLTDRILSQVREVTYGSGGSATISIGVAFTSGEAPATSEQLLAAADQSLYKAKAAGGDQTGSIIDATTV